MPEYDLCILCSQCGSFHDVLVRVFLTESFELRLVSDVYGPAFPAYFLEAICDHECPTTGRALGQQDPGEMLLVAVPWYQLDDSLMGATGN